MALPAIVPAFAAPSVSSVLLPAAVVGGGLILAGGAATAGVATAAAALTTGDTMSTYQDYLTERMPQLRDQGISPKDAMRQIGHEWREKKKGGNANKGADMPRETKMKGGLQSLRLELPLVVEAQPDLAALWDVAEGLVDFLLVNAKGTTDREAFVRRAAAAFARAKGETNEADGHEYRFGEALGEVLLLVMAHRGLTANEWVAMAPPQLGQESGIVSGAVESATGILGLTTDVNDDGRQTSIGEVIGTGVEGVIGLFND